MGLTKRLLEEREELEQSKAIAQYTLDYDLLENPAAIGVAKLVASQGDANLTKKQRYVFEKYIIPHTHAECKICDELLSIEELGDELCPHCCRLWDD